MAERRAVRWKRERERLQLKPKRHEHGVLVEVEDEWPGSGRTWLPYGTPGEASREYTETVEILESVQAWGRPTWVKLIHFGELKDETLIGPCARRDRLSNRLLRSRLG